MYPVVVSEPNDDDLNRMGQLSPETAIKFKIPSLLATYNKPVED